MITDTSVPTEFYQLQNTAHSLLSKTNAQALNNLVTSLANITQDKQTAGGPDHLGPRRADDHRRPAQRPGVPADRLGQHALVDAGQPGPAAAVGRQQPRHRLDRAGGQQPGPLEPDHQRRLHGEPDQQPGEPGLARAQLAAAAASTPTSPSSASTRTTWPRASATSAARSRASSRSPTAAPRRCRGATSSSTRPR